MGYLINRFNRFAHIVEEFPGGASMISSGYSTYVRVRVLEYQQYNNCTYHMRVEKNGAVAACDFDRSRCQKCQQNYSKLKLTPRTAAQL